ncbi:MAG TPA: winged helix-turn-helix transcriptional regulator [Pseudolabrys sp.]|nr:winged helix-turn-helix transcriptional regulator [Pseudolabrys sp.]
MKKRVYEDACGAAHALELIGDRWALLIIRELLFGAKRFSDLRKSLPGISANVLTQRLEELEADAILVRRKLPPPAAAWVYELTPWGLEAEELVKVIGRWAARSPSHDPSLPISVASTLLSMRTMFSPERARNISGKIGFRFADEEFVATLGKGKLSIGRGRAEEADVVVEGHQQALAGVIYGGLSLAKLEKAGALKVRGDRALFERYIGLFPLPPKAPDAQALRTGR